LEGESEIEGLGTDKDISVCSVISPVVLLDLRFTRKRESINFFG